MTLLLARADCREVPVDLAVEHFETMLRFSPNPNRAHLIPWQEWSSAAFRMARQQDKPVMLFLSAFWCRYCQRMDEEAFSETENIALLNAYFISLRVDNAQRPEIDARYNFHGWPTIAFMTPTGELLSVVNYLPPADFQDMLLRVYLAYQQKPANGLAATPSPAPVAEDPAVHTHVAAISAAALDEVTQAIMDSADRVNGGYDRGQKFIHPQVNEFLLERYKATKDQLYLDQVCLTLERMRAGEIYDRAGGAYFRTSSGADWSRPHREKLLSEEAGLLANCLGVLRITGRTDFGRMAEEIIDYLDARLFDPVSGAFCGCEDFLRDESPTTDGNEYYTILDRCIYADANAIASAAYLDAAALLHRPQYGERALSALEFLWHNCRDDGAGMFHYFDGTPHVPGLLQDQTQMGIALLRARAATAEAHYLDRARRLAEWILTELKNPAGGFYDVRAQDAAALGLRLTLIEHNGAAASFFLQLADVTGDPAYREAARWALCPFTGDFAGHGIHAAAFGRALSDYLGRR